MNHKLKLDMDALSVSSFETATHVSNPAGPSALTAVGCCPSPSNCNTKLTCSSYYC